MTIPPIAAPPLSVPPLAEPPHILWVTHPRHLPAPPEDERVIVVDVAFAAGKSQYKSKTAPFIAALGDRLVAWIDHHEHPVAWPQYKGNHRFILVPNDVAHACPELITEDVVARYASGDAPPQRDCIVAHADFDGALSAVKWAFGGKEPWPGADEDARAVDSPGRGHTLSVKGARYARALDEASARYDREGRCDFLDEMVRAICCGESDAFGAQCDTFSAAAADAEREAATLVKARGEAEHPHLCVVRVDGPLDNRMRKNVLVEAEEIAPVGVLVEPDPEGGHWLTAATFVQGLDLSKLKGWTGGRTDFRFTRASQGGHQQLALLSTFVDERLPVD